MAKTKNQNVEKISLVAPCGIYCGVCKRYLATVNGSAKKMGLVECIGCRPRNKKCNFIRSCKWLRGTQVNFCFECEGFSCKKLERLNRRYTARYDTSLINNLLEIKEIGIERWLKNQESIWRCPECGGTISVHGRECSDCRHEMQR